MVDLWTDYLDVFKRVPFLALGNFMVEVRGERSGVTELFFSEEHRTYL